MMDLNILHRTQEYELVRIKKDKEYALKFKGPDYTINAIPLKENNGKANKIAIGINSLDARWQKEFYQDAPASGCRKYVHEIKTYADAFNAGDPICGSSVTYYTSAYLRIKLEWKTCRRNSWNLSE